MSSAVPTKRQVSTNTLPSGRGVIDWLRPFFTTSVGMKATTAVTGALLTGFVIVHLIGNLKVLAGPESINSYARALKDLGPLLWLARGGLLTVFVVHVVLALWLAKRSAAARPIPYQFKARIQATRASLSMPWTGLAIFAFAIFHLAHFTFGWIRTTPAKSTMTGELIDSNYLDLVDAQGRHDVYTMMVRGFQNPYVAVIYLVAMALLFIHLKHGIGSVFQSLGLNAPRIQPFLRWFSLTVAAVIVLGNIAIVVLVWMGQVPVDPIAMTRAGIFEPPPTN
jgi:succinate dehydrogenase / fumarate reductase cytochrome b subunit